ncbi:MAG TPA: hypothetical protein VH165_15005, partial [Kofleriaceae bacterium]|nr:hypothetical protein [Kofleriaceae bacterium]
MRIVSVASRTLRWTIHSRGAARGRTERAAVLLEVRSDHGAHGLGEAAPLPGMSPDTLDDAERALATFAARAPFELPDVAAAVAIAQAATRSPAARFAIETALLDALACHAQVSIATLLRSAHVGAADSAESLGDARLGSAEPPRESRAGRIQDTSTAHVGAPGSAEPLGDARLGPAEPPRESRAGRIPDTIAHVGAPDSAEPLRDPRPRPAEPLRESRAGRIPDTITAHVGAPDSAEPLDDARLGFAEPPRESRAGRIQDTITAHVGAIQDTITAHVGAPDSAEPLRDARPRPAEPLRES